MNLPPSVQQINEFASKHKVPYDYAQRTLLNDHFFKELEDIRTASIAGKQDSLKDTQDKLARLAKIMEYVLVKI